MYAIDLGLVLFIYYYLLVLFYYYITQDNDIKAEISMRLQSAYKCFYGLSQIFRSRAISKNLKVRMNLNVVKANCSLWSRNMVTEKC